MKIEWIVSSEDVNKIKEFLLKYADDPFVKLRAKRNLNVNTPPISRDLFWQVMVSALLTTQQRSGPDSPVNRFLSTKPFLLSYSLCKTKSNLEKFVRDTLADAEGIRRFNRIAEEVSANFEVLESGQWEEVLSMCKNLQSSSNPMLERRAAHHIDEVFKGFGPKQSRNLLQWLGLTRYEIPLDSRITKWLNKFGFPVKLSSSLLSEPHYYDFVSDGVQRLCEEADVYPCVLDAAIFTSYDKGKWTEQNLRASDVFSV